MRGATNDGTRERFDVAISPTSQLLGEPPKLLDRAGGVWAACELERTRLERGERVGLKIPTDLWTLPAVHISGPPLKTGMHPTDKAVRFSFFLIR